MDAAQPVRQEFSEAVAAAALTEAASRAGLDSSGARILRLGQNAVFALPNHVVARVVRGGTDDPHEATRTLAVARWLRDAGVPAVEPIDVEQPIRANGLLVTFWRSLGNADRYGSTAQLAALLRRLHTLELPPGLELPQLDPFARARSRLDAAPLAAEDRTFLLHRLQALQTDWRRLDFALPAGVIHGDANVGNVLVDPEGVARLIDLDSVCVGPREWDLILTAIYCDRYGWHTPEEYDALVAGYGWDVRTWTGYETLADVRELLMVAWMSQNVVQNERTATEFTKRIYSMRSDVSRRDWQPF